MIPVKSPQCLSRQAAQDLDGFLGGKIPANGKVTGVVDYVVGCGHGLRNLDLDRMLHLALSAAPTEPRGRHW